MNLPRDLPMIFLLGITVFAEAVSAAQPETFWISSVPPKRSASAPAAIASTGADSGLAADETDSAYATMKRLWFRLGDEVGQAAYLRSAPGMHVEKLDALGRRAPASTIDGDGVAQVRMDLQEKGFSNLYARREQRDGQTLWVQLAKAEMLRGSFREREVAAEQLTAIRDAEQPLEIVREHPEQEALFTRIVSGDRIDFTILSHGRPIQGIPVTMITQQGWQKKLLSDADGRVGFTLIRDYFPPWREFRRRVRETFLVVADRELPETGRFDGGTYTKIRYQATLSGRYALSPRDYSSYAYGLGITIFVTAFGGLAVYLYRRRRVKPFREIRFGHGG